jgi:hypothetical protein
MNRKLTISVGVLLFATALLLFLSEYAVVLSAALLATAYVKHWLYPIEKEWAWFVLIAVAGGLAEMVLVNVAEAWSYETPHILGVPVWMPLFWGLAGTTLVVAHDGLTGGKSREKAGRG